MLYLYTIIFGIVQGLTEFWPVSSSAHLLILHQWLNLGWADYLSFDVALHLGTLMALLFFFARDLWRLVTGFFSGLFHRGFSVAVNPDGRLSLLILWATWPVLIFGYFAENILEQVFRNLTSVAWLLIFFGLLFFFYEKLGLKNSLALELSWGQALKIGLAQVLALIPGVSRSGITIIAGLGENLKRSEAARFSFLLSVPAVLGAGVKKIYDLTKVGFTAPNELQLMLLGVAVSALTGYFCLKYFLRYLENHSLAIFGWYRIALGLLVLLLVYIL